MKPELSRFLGVCLAVPLVGLLLAGCDDRAPLAPELDARSAGSGPTVNAPSGANALAVSWSQINASWQDNSSNESGFELHRSTTGPSGAFTLLTSTGANITSYGSGGLAGSTQYCYEVRAFRTSGGKTTYSAFSGVACATTPVSPLPAAPTAVHAAPYQGEWIIVTWTDNSKNETRFRIERASASSGPWTSVAYPDSNVTWFNDRGVFGLVEQALCYRVFAYNSYGDSPASNVFCTAVPSIPGNLAANLPGDGSVQLTWTDNSAVEDGYQVQQETSPATVLATLPPNATGYRDPAPLPDNTYWYCVFPTRDGGTGYGACVQVVVATSAPAAPSGLGVQPTSSSSVSGQWTDQSTNEAGFRIERSTDGGASWVTAVTAGIDESTFNDSGLVADQHVCYRVSAFNNVGESAPSNTACTAPPAGPTNLTVVAGVDPGTVDLVWSDNSAVEDGYEVWVDGGYGYLYSIASLAPNATTYQGAPNSYYAYFVVAVKDGGYSDLSNAAYPPPPPGTSGVRAGATSPLSAPRAARRPSTQAASAGKPMLRRTRVISAQGKTSTKP